ncbi:KIF1A [Symbiodinium sp. CCMP2456]|nr:KIF1A [Symbiodinium sp. CCMP2456]
MGQSLAWVARECWDRSSQGCRCEACDRAACLETSSEDRVQWLMWMCERQMLDISSRDEDLQSCRDDIAELLDHCRRLVKMAENTREEAMVIELQAKVRELQLDSRELRLLVQETLSAPGSKKSRTSEAALPHAVHLKRGQPGDVHDPVQEQPCRDQPGTQSTEPVHVLQAHSEAISQALLLRSSRIPEALEDLLWKGPRPRCRVGFGPEPSLTWVEVEAEVDSPKTKSTQAPAADSFWNGSTEHDCSAFSAAWCSDLLVHFVLALRAIPNSPFPFEEAEEKRTSPVLLLLLLSQPVIHEPAALVGRHLLRGWTPGCLVLQAFAKVQTAVRLRPFLPNELSKLGTAPVSCVEMKPNGHVVLSDPEKPQQPGREFECTFAFDSSRPKSDNYSDQRTIYNSVGAEMVMHGTTGFNCCLVAYGQTGTGKTHTVHGDWQSHEHRGLLPRISEGLFQRLDQCRAEGASWRVRISYVEVYNDRLRDLLEHAGPSLSRTENDSPSPRRFSKPGTAAGPRLEIRNHPAVGVYVENLQELPVEHLRDVARLVSKGEKAKKVERTTMNDRSSRSHTIFMFKVEVRNASNGDHMSTVQVVDLAGRENEQTSECKGDRFRELRHINRSLFDLASCIHALCDGNRDHVPFRNSKLTMLLSDSLASNSRTTLLATLTPSSAGFDENILTCRFLESTVVPVNGEPMATCDGRDGDAARQVEPLLGGPDPVILKLDERSFTYYIPTITGDKDPGAWYDELTAVLQNSTLTMPTPPKDTSAENERAQFYAAGTFDHTVPDAGLQAMDFRYNPRWCLAGRPLENLQCILDLKRMVEEEVGKILAMEHQPLGETKISPDLLQPFFNSILVNFYKDGKAQIKWHADDENCYGPSDNILIGSLSFGAARVFEVRRKPRRGDTDRSAQQLQRILLQPGSLLVMGGAMQANWQHSLPPDPSCLEGRVNLTFRRIVGGRITTQPVVNHFGAAEVQKHLQDEIANLQSTLVEEAVIASRQTLLKQFSEVWSDHHLQALQGAQEDSRLTVVHGACRQVSSSLQGAEESLSQLEERNHEAAKALQKVGRKLANVEKAIRSVQSRKAGYKGYASGSPDSTATTAGEDRVPGILGGDSASHQCPAQFDGSGIGSWSTLTGLGSDVNLIDPCTATVSWVLYGHTDRVTALAECADGRFVTGGADGAIRLWAKRTWSASLPAQDALHSAADASADGAEPPQLSAEAWRGALGESVKPGVCSMAFYAHTQQARRGEMAALFLRVLVQSGSNLIKADGYPAVPCYAISEFGAGRGFEEISALRSYVAAAELLKLVASLSFLVVAGEWHRAFTGWTWRIGLRESIWPAMAYALQNVAGTAANKSLDAVTCNVLNQTKLLWTAAFVVLRKQRQFTFREWVALTMILLASLLTACDGDGLQAEPYWGRCQGVACACLAAMCSAFGAVLTEEALVKGRDPFLLSAELALGGLGTLFLTFPFTMLEQGTAERFYGWTWATLLPLFTHAGGGILVGIVTKHLGSVNKAILMVVSLLLTGTLKVLIDHRWPSAPSMLSIGLVAAGLALYCDLGNRIVVFCHREKPMFDVLQPLHLHYSWYRTLLGHPRRPQPLKVESFHWVREYLNLRYGRNRGLASRHAVAVLDVCFMSSLRTSDAKVPLFQADASRIRLPEICSQMAELPECSWLDLEVVLCASRKKAARSIARCSVLLEEVVQQLADSPSKELIPSARKLYSPLGQGPYQELVDAELFVGFFEGEEGVVGISVKPMPGLAVGFTNPTFVRATVRQSCAGAVQSLPAKVRDVTEVRSQTVNPHWGEILEFEIPVFVGDRHVSHSPDYRLHFQLFGKERMNSDKLLAELFIPLADAIRADGQKAQSFELKPTEQLMRGKKAKRSSAASDTVKPPDFVRYPTLMPCPKQIQCTVERLDNVKYAGTVDKNLQVRMCFVEGDAMLSHTTVRTSVKQQTIKPVWKQRCVFDMPPQLLRSGFEPRPPSVRKGWVHDTREVNESNLVVCIDICDRDAISGTDSFMCRGQVPLRSAWEAATKGRSVVSPQWVNLTPSAGGRLQVGFSTSPAKDQLIVHIMGAEKLPGRATSGLADPFCLVRLAFMGQLGEPTDQASVNLPFVTTPAGELTDGTETLFFQHQEVLELPGALSEGMVAARASWHYQVDLVDMKKQVVLCSGSISVQEMLDDICRTEGRCEVTQYTIREKLEESKSLLQKPSTPDPFADDVRCGSILRKIVLKQLDKPYKAALDQGVADAASPKAKRKQVGEAIGSALVTLGLRNNTERVDRGTDDMELYVRFQVVSRWKGLSRGSRSPPSVPMRAPSAVRCIATLANSIVAGYEDGNVFVWDACGQSSPLHQFQAHEVPVSAIAVLPPLGCVVTAGEVRNGLEARDWHGLQPNSTDLGL